MNEFYKQTKLECSSESNLIQKNNLIKKNEYIFIVFFIMK